MLFDGGNVFEAEVTDAMRAIYAGTDSLLVVNAEDWDEGIRLTLQAMTDRVPVIVNGRLPNVDGRAGAPDVLILSGDGYLPADIKGHQTLTKPPTPGSASRRSVTVSDLRSPDTRMVHAGQSNKGNSWRDDVMQLAHYTRMLQGLGLHAGGDGTEPETLIGAIIGTTDFSEVTGDKLGFTWYDLTVADQETYSTRGAKNRAKRSALERYDHEFDFRIKVAEAARAGGELVRPLGVDECKACVWLSYCKSVVPDDDASFALEAGQLSAREWLLLYPDGGEFSVSDLAAVDVDRAAEEFARSAVGRTKPADRLADAVRRARLTVAGKEIEPLEEGAWPEVPSADVEVDFDIEWDLDNRIYQWGLRIRENQDESTARYQPVVSFEPMDEAAELALAERFAATIESLVEAAEGNGQSVAIYHWHHVEISLTRRFESVARALEGRTLDLLNAWFNKHFFARQTSSIKNIAPVFGFEWSVDDPGGRFSQEQIDKARAGDVAAKRWCLRYNESDVAAQAAIRDGARRLGR